MGFIVHDTIVVTDDDGDRVWRSLQMAIELGLPVSNVVDSPFNEVRTFTIATDGSKGSLPDEASFVARETWKLWMRFTMQDVRSWVHVRYPETGEGPVIVDDGFSYWDRHSVFWEEVEPHCDFHKFHVAHLNFLAASIKAAAKDGARQFSYSWALERGADGSVVPKFARAESYPPEDLPFAEPIECRGWIQFRFGRG